MAYKVCDVEADGVLVVVIEGNFDEEVFERGLWWKRQRRPRIFRVRRVRCLRGRREALQYIHMRWFGGMAMSCCVVNGGKLKQAFLRM